MSKGRRPKKKDDGSVLPVDPPDVLTQESEKKAYRRLRSHLVRLGTSRASDVEVVCVTARRLARIELLYAKLDRVVSADELIMGVTDTTG